MLNAMLPVVAVSAIVPAVTAALKFAPPLLVTVKFNDFVPPIAPLAVIAPVVLKIRVLELAVVIPFTVPLNEIGVAAPAPIVNVVLSGIATTPNVICPVDEPPIVVLAVTFNKFTGLMVIALEPLAAIIPAKYTFDGAVAVTPPAKVVFVLLELPIVAIPVLLKVTAFVKLFVFAPSKEKLYDPAASVNVVAVKPPKNATV